jgi:hypothetical protein
LKNTSKSAVHSQREIFNSNPAKNGGSHWRACDDKCANSRLALLDPTTADKAQQHHDYGDHQKNMDETPEGIGRDQAK